MKRSILIIVTILCVVGVVNAGLTKQSYQPGKVYESLFPESVERTERLSREFSFTVPPMNIMPTWHDYFPAGSRSFPLRVQPSPAGYWDGGGVYLVFEANTSDGGEKRTYYTYIENNFITSGPSLISLTGQTAESSPVMDIDQATGNPFVVWNQADAGDPDLFSTMLSFDNYSFIGVPGLWSPAYSIMSGLYEPLIFIGPSPNTGQKRLYVFFQGEADFSYVFVDYTNAADLEYFNVYQWTYQTIPQLDNWFSDDISLFASAVVSGNSGHLAIMGHTQQNGTEDPYHENNVLFVLENNNYGQGGWNLFTGDSTIPVVNPGNFFTDDDDQPYTDMRYRMYVNRHNTVIDNQGNYHFTGLYALFAEDNTWYPDMTTVKHIKFDRNTEEFIISDLYPRDLTSESFYLPWDYPPEFDDQGNLIYNPSWPCWKGVFDELEDENYHRMVIDGNSMISLFQVYNPGEDLETHIIFSPDSGNTWSQPIILSSADTAYLAGMIPIYWYPGDVIQNIYGEWHRIHLMFYSPGGPANEGNLYYAVLDINPEYHPDPPPLPPPVNLTYEILEDNTVMLNWEEPEFNYNAPELLRYHIYRDDVYYNQSPPDDLFYHDIGTEVKVHYQYYVKAVYLWLPYGSIASEPSNTVDVIITGIEKDLIPDKTILYANYPNPFNPETRIAFYLAEETKVKLEIYNIRGQLIRTLMNEIRPAGEGYVVWDGTDEENRGVASGVYLYRFTAGIHTGLKKMLFLK